MGVLTDFYRHQPLSIIEGTAAILHTELHTSMDVELTPHYTLVHTLAMPITHERVNVSLKIGRKQEAQSVLKVEETLSGIVDEYLKRFIASRKK